MIPLVFDLWWIVSLGTGLTLILVIGFISTILLNQRRFIDLQQKRMKDLRESEQKYSDLFNNVSDIIYIHSLNGILLQVNAAVISLLGFSVSELQGKHLKDLIVPKYRNRVDAYLDDIKQKNDSSGYMVLFSKEKKTIVLEYRNSMIIEDGKPVAVRGIARNVTEQKKIEKALSESEAKFRTLVENSTDAICVFHKQAIVFVNNKFQQLLGYSLQDLQQSYPEFTVKINEQINHLFHEDGEFSSEQAELLNFIQTFRSSYGKEIDFEITLALISWRRQRAVLVSMHDVTERNRLEAQLRHAAKMEAIGSLAAGVAHDFNNLLTAINGYSEIILNRLKGKNSVRNEVEQIIQAGGKASNLTDQLLAFSRRQILDKRVVCLNDVIKNLNQLLSRLLSKNIRFITECSESLASVKADVNQIEQIIVNLVVNAKDAMPEGGTLAIKTTNIDVDLEFALKHNLGIPGRYVQLTVGDTGTGIEPSVLERIFEPFFTTKEPGKGTGLGLATVYGIVRQNHGAIHIESELDVGTNVYIYFPAVDEKPDVLETKAKTGIPLKGSETILVVEDGDEVRGLVVQSLEELGYTVLQAENGDEAIKIAHHHPSAIHLLLTDVVMPGMNGKELAEKIKRVYPKLHVLYMSGYSDDIIVHDGSLEKGINFIQKPFSVYVLSEKIRSILDNSVLDLTSHQDLKDF